MKLLLDQDVYEVTARFLISLGLDVVRISELGMSTASDEENLSKAIELMAGVLYLRILPSTTNQVHLELERVLKHYDSEKLRSAFIVVEAGRHRFRKI